MSSIMEEFDHLKIQMEDIISATDNFSPKKLIGHGGFGPVYKGQLSLPAGPTMVAFKRLDRRFGQGNTEFWKEIMMLSKYKHENLISLLHFCIKGEERVLVYEYASRGSLDHYLSDASLTWNQRLHICIDVAHAPKYLHDPMKTQQRILHRDIKSSNILLDENWTAKVSDFGLSKISPANQLQTYLISNVVGTPGYCDPLYWEMGFLSKESDVYSFGVVLFEVMCGRLCCEYHYGKLIGILVHEWKKCCDEKKLGEIILQGLKEQTVWDSILTFSAVANRCLNRDRRDRPTMDEIVKELEIALQQHTNNIYESDLLKIAKLTVHPLLYTTQKELILLLSHGILIEGQRWVSINENKEMHVIISATQCFHGQLFECLTVENSRFLNVILCPTKLANFKVNVNTELLSPNIEYMMKLVFTVMGKKDRNTWAYAPFIYKLDEETHIQSSSFPYMREDGWLLVNLYQFTNNNKEHKLEIQFSIHNESDASFFQYVFEGIELRPVEHV